MLAGSPGLICSSPPLLLPARHRRRRLDGRRPYFSTELKNYNIAWLNGTSLLQVNQLKSTRFSIANR
jgi:hypothetical protein